MPVAEVSTANLAFFDKKSEKTIGHFVTKKGMTGSVTPIWQIIFGTGVSSHYFENLPGGETIHFLFRFEQWHWTA